jgi:two-component system alkaline phosphatase synthesis response regulator PhoP
MDERIKILVVEDEERIRAVLKYNLEFDGFEVHLAEDGKAGLQKAREIKPDLILLDWMMPEMDGLQVLSELKHDEATKDITVFMLTAKSMMGEVGRALYEGADDYLTKPFDVVELGQMLKEKLEKARA